MHATVDDLGTRPKFLKLCMDGIRSTNPPKDIVKDIEKDVPRTFAGHNTRVNTVHGHAALNLLLRANAVYVMFGSFITRRFIMSLKSHEYSIATSLSFIKQENHWNALEHRYSPAIGYAQSLNIMTAFFLSVDGMKLVDAFWLLVTITTRHARAYHVPSMGGFLLDVSVLTRLCQDRLPKIFKHMTRLQVPMLMAANRSLLSGLVLCVPTRSLLRIFDVTFVHGTSVWISVLLTMMREFRDVLLGTFEREAREYQLCRSLTHNAHEFVRATLSLAHGISLECTLEHQHTRIRNRYEITRTVSHGNEILSTAMSSCGYIHTILFGNIQFDS